MGYATEKTHLWKVALAVANEQARLAAATVADDDNLLGKARPLGHGGPRGFPACRSAHRCADCPVA